LTKTLRQKRAQQKRIAEKKAKRSRQAAGKEAMSTQALLKEAIKIRDSKDIEAARIFLRVNGFKDWRNFY
jgi:hypothetical protein